jgi:hypothetical protein
VNCGDVQVERGAVLAGGIFSVYSAAAEVRPMNDNQPASPPKADVSKQRHKHILKRFDWECDPRSTGTRLRACAETERLQHGALEKVIGWPANEGDSWSEKVSPPRGP